MNINGSLVIKGILDTLEVSGIAAASSTGEDGENTQGVIKFSNGFKIQWDTVDVPDDSTTEFDLPEPYTEAHYNVLVCYAGDIVDSAQTTGTHGHLPAANTLSKVALKQIYGSSTEPVTYISWGKDTV